MIVDPCASGQFFLDIPIAEKEILSTAQNSAIFHFPGAYRLIDGNGHITEVVDSACITVRIPRSINLRIAGSVVDIRAVLPTWVRGGNRDCSLIVNSRGRSKSGTRNVQGCVSCAIEDESQLLT